jgi:hypothetical protein
MIINKYNFFIGWQLDQQYGLYAWVKYIQFLLFDASENTFTWTPRIGGKLISQINSFGIEVGGETISTSIQAFGSSFQIVSILVTTDQFHTLKFFVQYSYTHCNSPVLTISSTKSIPSIQEEYALIQTTTISFNSCVNKTDQSKVYGSENTARFSSQFNVRLEDLKAIVIYSGAYIFGFQFKFLNDDSLTYGNPNSIFLFSNFTVDLENKTIVAVRIQNWLVVTSIRFLIYDMLSRTYFWTTKFGGSKGKSTTISSREMIHSATSFQINSLFGTSDSQYIRTLSFSYSYRICNPTVTGDQLPVLTTTTNY